MIALIKCTIKVHLNALFSLTSESSPYMTQNAEVTWWISRAEQHRFFGFYTTQ